MKFTQFLWDNSQLIIEKIANHPFNLELSLGSLNRNRFTFFLEQDAYYLNQYAQVLSLIAKRSSDPKIIQQFIHYSEECLVSERQLHLNFLEKDINSDTIELSPACAAYTNYLLATALTASVEEAIAAILPCFWIYREIGKILVNNNANRTTIHPYKNWIETYADPEFSKSTDEVIEFVDKVASETSLLKQKKMHKAFEYSAIYEWQFWDDAYHMRLLKTEMSMHSSLSVSVSVNGKDVR